MADKKSPKDINELAKYIVDVSTCEADKIEPPKKNLYTQLLSELGSSKGGKARAAKLSDKKKREISKKAATVNWQNYHEEQEKSS